MIISIIDSVLLFSPMGSSNHPVCIWVALRDPTLAVRERAVEALRAFLRVIEKRETRWRVQWYYRMFEATQDGLGKNAFVHSIHGSLLAVGELLRCLIIVQMKLLISR
ncbi:unnamed protein product [Lactuca saligna]|uniref:Uncharacterized protein n=1 Tax=Lactuca saligna TaxID=75948 RepID=A0AA36A4D0_LACSI|nr:unnamed protein product [Lactuca saligna]